MFCRPTLKTSLFSFLQIEVNGGLTLLNTVLIVEDDRTGTASGVGINNWLTLFPVTSTSNSCVILEKECDVARKFRFAEHLIPFFSIGRFVNLAPIDCRLLLTLFWKEAGCVTMEFVDAEIVVVSDIIGVAI